MESMKLSFSKNKISTFQRVFISVVLLSVLMIVVAPLFGKTSNNQPESPQYLDSIGYIDYKDFRSFPNTKNVLFFKANWCSSCSVAEDNIISEMRSIPTYLTIYKVDFERETALREKYGVSTQHTFVQVDHMGNALKIWKDSYTIQSILDELV